MGFRWLYITRFYNNAAKIFGMEDVLCRRFVNFAIKRCLKQAEGVDYQRLPLGFVFLLFFSSCRRLCRRFIAINPNQYKKPNNQSGILLPKAYSISSAAINALSALAICLPSLLAPPTSIVYLRSITKSPCLAYSTECA